MTAARRALAGLSGAAPAGELITRWDNFRISSSGPLAGRTAQGTNGGWTWEVDNGALGTTMELIEAGGGRLERRDPGDGYQLIYTDMGAGNINVLFGWKMSGSNTFLNDSGLMIRGIDETNMITLNSYINGTQVKQIDNTAEQNFADFARMSANSTYWFRITETAGTTLLEFWENPPDSAAPPDDSVDLTGLIATKFLTATKVGTGQWYQAQASQRVGVEARMYAASDPSLLPTDAIGPIP